MFPFDFSDNDPTSCRISLRKLNDNTHNDYKLGFRLVMAHDRVIILFKRPQYCIQHCDDNAEAYITSNLQ